MRRIDGRSVGTFLREEICDPRGLDLWIGVPPAVEARMATLEYAADGGCDGPAAERLASDDLLRRYWANPVLYPPERVIWNDRALASTACAIGSRSTPARRR